MTDGQTERTSEQLRNHYEVERAIAQRLKSASREERKAIYATMYDELFEKVPDHPRLTRRQNDTLTATHNRRKLDLIEPYLDKRTTFLEYASGDCRFVAEVATRVQYAYGLDISDQREPDQESPKNFQLIVYDGYNPDRIPEGSVDVIFSDQLIEHFHPEDTRQHFETAYRLLARGGVYIFCTPHALTGPHDISMYFSDVPQGFHLKEWNHGELRTMLEDVGYSQTRTVWYRRGISLHLPYLYFRTLERTLAWIPRRYARRMGRVLLSTLCVVAHK